MKFWSVLALIILAGCASQVSTERHGAHLMSGNPADYVAILASPTFELGNQQEFSVEIMRKDGSVPHFQQLHERMLHVMLIRNDLQYFAHAHPDDSMVDVNTGIFRFTHAFVAPGKYRVMLEFIDHDKKVAVPLDLVVPGIAKDVPIIYDFSREKSFGNYTITLDTSSITTGKEAKLGFNVMQEGKPIDYELFLGEQMHLMVWKQGLTYFEHAHPDAHDELHFHVTFPTPGVYKIFPQFQHEGNVITGDFLVNAE